MTDKILMIDSRSYPGQNPNDLTIQLNEEIDNVHGMRIIFVGIPCSFYNISQDLGNNILIINDGTTWKYLNIPDGFYDLRSFDNQVGVQLKKMGLYPRAFKFDLDETTGKILITFRKSQNKTYKLSIRSYNKDLFGFDIPPYTGLEIPRRMRDPKNPSKIINESVSVGDKPANFKPFEYFQVHCDLIDTEQVLYNGERSDILARIPLKECSFGELITYYLTGLRDRKCKKRFRKFRLWITDENNKPINFNGDNVQYELLFRRLDEIS